MTTEATVSPIWRRVLTLRKQRFGWLAGWHAAVLMVALGGPLSAQEPDQRVRAYVSVPANTSGFVDSYTGIRDEVVSWIQKKKQKSVVAVERPEDADVRVEILEILESDGGTTNTAHIGGGFAVSKRGRAVYRLRARLLAGEYALPITTEDKRLHVAARLIADDVERWVKANRTQVLARRTGKTTG